MKKSLRRKKIIVAKEEMEGGEGGRGRREERGKLEFGMFDVRRKRNTM